MHFAFGLCRRPFTRKARPYPKPAPVILSVGAIFFKMQRTEKNRLELSWIEAYYFAVVTATSIGALRNNRSCFIPFALSNSFWALSTMQATEILLHLQMPVNSFSSSTCSYQR